VNTSHEPFSNIALSLLGDATVPAMLWLALGRPWLFFPMLGLALAGTTALLWWLGRFLRQLWRRLAGGSDALAPTSI
jgi:hypothetical protein